MEVAVVVFDGVFDSGLTSILDVLDNANVLGGQIHEPPTWNVTMVGSTPQVRTGAGLLVTPQPLECAQTTDLLVVPGLAGTSPDALLDHVGGDVSLPVRNLIARTRDHGTNIGSACAGSFFLAEAGILEGLRATTTWWLSPTFRARYPGVHLDHSQMVITNDGITTAGAAFGHVDLALAIVRASSPALADLVASYLVIDERPSQAAYTIPSALAQSDPTVAAFERWIRERLDGTISLRDAANAIGVSERTLQRSVQRTIGTSPIRFVQDLRIERASHLLRTTDLSLEAISRKVGYQQPNTLRTLLRDRTGKTTSALRRR
ncbi:MAG TPA: helix-turn-helix domain-containing protein [Acidimicrobiales bacterium]|jgi:transcriptional regulator GlxA family with amidase domain